MSIAAASAHRLGWPKGATGFSKTLSRRKMAVVQQRQKRTTDCPCACNCCTSAASHRTATPLVSPPDIPICRVAFAMTESHLDSASLACSASVPRFVVECLGGATRCGGHGLHCFFLSLLCSCCHCDCDCDWSFAGEKKAFIKVELRRVHGRLDSLKC